METSVIPKSTVNENNITATKTQESAELETSINHDLSSLDRGSLSSLSLPATGEKPAELPKQVLGYIEQAKINKESGDTPAAIARKFLEYIQSDQSAQKALKKTELELPENLSELFNNLPTDIKTPLNKFLDKLKDAISELDPLKQATKNLDIKGILKEVLSSKLKKVPEEVINSIKEFKDEETEKQDINLDGFSKYKTAIYKSPNFPKVILGLISMLNKLRF